MISIDKNRGLYNREAALNSGKGGGGIDLNKSFYDLEGEASSRGYSEDLLSGKQRFEDRYEAYRCTVCSKGAETFREGMFGEMSGSLYTASHSNHIYCRMNTPGTSASASSARAVGGMIGSFSTVSDSDIGNCTNARSLLFENHDNSLLTNPMNSNIPTTPHYGRPYQEKEKDEVPYSRNEVSKPFNDAISECGVGLASAAVSTPSEKQNTRKRCNSGIDLNKKPRQRLRVKKHRPKVIVEGKPRKTPKPRAPKASTSQPQTPKPWTPKRATSKKSPYEKKYARKNSHKASVNSSQVEDGQAVYGSPEYAAKSCKRALNFNLESQEKDGNNDKEIVTSKSLHDNRNNSLKASENSSEDVDEQTVDPNPEYAEHPCRRALNFNSENQAPDEKGVRKIVHHYQRRSKSVEKSSCKWNFNLNLRFQESVHFTEMSNKLLTDITSQSNKGKEPMVENLAGMVYGFTKCKNYIQTDHMSLGEREVAIYQNNPRATNQTGCHYNSLRVYQRIFQCQKNSRKFGPNFPKICKKRRMNRLKATMPKTLWSVIAEEVDQRQLEVTSKRKVAVGHCTLGTTKKQLAPKRLKRVRNSKVYCNSGIASCNSLMQVRYSRMISPTEEQTRAAINDPESFMCVLSLHPFTELRRKRSKRFTQRRNLASPTAYPNCKQLPSTPLLQSLISGRQEIEYHKPKPCMEVQLEDNENILTKGQNTIGSSLRNAVSYQNEFKVCSLQCEDISLETEMCPPQRKNDLLEMEWCPPQHEHAALEIEGCPPQCEDVLLAAESSKDAFVRQMIEYAIQRFECLCISDECGQLVVRDQNAYGAHNGHGALVPYEGKFDPSKKRKKLPKVDLDPETRRVWKLLMENDGSEGVEEVNHDKEKWWEEQREVFRGRVDSFIARMHLIQGNRRFSPWKGSVVDSVVGVYLTQNVSDHLSSSAFMSLAARFPLQSTGNQGEYVDEEKIACSQESVGSNSGADRQVHDTFGKQSTACGTEQDISHNFAEIREVTLATKTGRAISDAVEDSTEAKDSFPIQNFDGSFRDGNPTTTGNPCTVESSTTFTELLQLEEVDSLQQFYSRENKKLTCNESLVDGNIETRGMEKGKQLLGSDRLFDLKGTYASGDMHNSHNPCCKIPPALADVYLDFLDPVGDFRNRRLKEVGDISKDLEHVKFLGSETIVQKNDTPGAHEATIVDPYASLGKCQVYPYRSLQEEVITEKNLHSSNDEQGENKMTFQSETPSRRKKSKVEEKRENKIEWDDLRKTYSNSSARETTANTMDSLDWEGVRRATVEEVSNAIALRGMNNVLAARIKEFLDRMVKDHGRIDLEWLRDVPPDKAKEYLLSIRGLGLKSVECVRLLTLHHVAFPVDTNVGRVAVRLGWVPLQPLPEEVQIHLLNQYPMVDTIQKYLWPRLCTLDQRTLYELHYQLITFGKVFCTKRRPNCNVCPMRGECRHFASAFASSRLALPGPQGRSMVTSKIPVAAAQNSTMLITPPMLFLPEINVSDSRCQTQICEPIIEVPPSPEPEYAETPERDIEDFFSESEDEMPTIRLNNEEFKEKLQNYIDMTNILLQEGDMSKALVALTSEPASIPMPKLKYVSRLRTVHQVYELPDSHPLLAGLDKREPDDPCPYLLAIWTLGETANSPKQAKNRCNSQESEICYQNTCYSCNNFQEENFETVSGTILVPCRTATRGSFPLNGTYFQVNEVFADDESSHHPINVPRAWIWNLPRRNLYCGTSATSIFRGLLAEEIQYCFWRGFVCVRGYHRTTRKPRRLADRFHLSISAAGKTKTTDGE